MSTLAAAYAEAGNMDEAIRWINDAVELAAKTPESVLDLPVLNRMKKDFEVRKPFRENRHPQGKMRLVWIGQAPG